MRLVHRVASIGVVSLMAAVVAAVPSTASPQAAVAPAATTVMSAEGGAAREALGAPKCSTRKESMYSHKNCRGWGGRYKGAAINDVYSVYTTANSTGWGERLFFSIRLKDVRPDGLCAAIKVEKTGSYASRPTVANPKACGKGTSVHWSRDFSGNNAWLTPGSLRLYLCVRDNDCTRVFSQTIK